MTHFTSRLDSAGGGYAPAGPTRSDHEVVELQLLLPMWQAAALEAAAQSRGMTTGQILRRVIADLFAEPQPVGH